MTERKCAECGATESMALLHECEGRLLCTKCLIHLGWRVDAHEMENGKIWCEELSKYVDKKGCKKCSWDSCEESGEYVDWWETENE